MSEPGASGERVHIGDTPRLTAAGDSGVEIDEAEVIHGAKVSRCVTASSVLSGDSRRTRIVRRQLGDTAFDPEQVK